MLICNQTRTLRLSLIEEACSKALDGLSTNASRDELLLTLVNAAENSFPNTVSSILVIDESGLLRNGCSPQLPADYLAAIDGLKPDARVGTCAAAAATGNMVVTESFIADDKWAELKHLPIALGFKGAWSVPIKTADGCVLGTFGTYFRETRKPSREEIEGISKLSSAAAEILCRKQ